MGIPIWDREFDRRSLLKLSAGTVAALTAGPLLVGSRTAEADVRRMEPVSWRACQKMTLDDMVARSLMAKAGYEYLLKCAGEICNRNVRAIVLEGLKEPKPKLMELYTAPEQREEIRRRLLVENYIKTENTIEQIFPPCAAPDQCVQSFKLSPGSGWKSHHAYPGGLVSHVATDLQIALAAYKSYEEIYGYEMNRELILSAILLHDNQKPWVLQWLPDGSCLPEANIAGTGAHHILAIADAVYRQLSPELVVAIACSHDHPGFAGDEEQVVNWIKAAAILAGVDPVKYGVLAAGAKTLPLPRRQEGFLVHLGDHDYVLTAPVSKWLSEKLRDIAQSQYGLSEGELNGRPFNTLRNYLYSQLSDMQLYQLWVEKGDAALVKTVTGIVVP